MKLTVLSGYIQIRHKLENATMQNTALTVIARDCTCLPCNDCPLLVLEYGKFKCIASVDPKRWYHTVQRMIGKEPA